MCTILHPLFVGYNIHVHHTTHCLFCCNVPLCYAVQQQMETYRQQYSAQVKQVATYMRLANESVRLLYTVVTASSPVVNNDDDAKNADFEADFRVATDANGTWFGVVGVAQPLLGDENEFFAREMTFCDRFLDDALAQVMVVLCRWA